MLFVRSWYQSYCLVRQLSTLSRINDRISAWDCGNSSRDRTPSAAARRLSPKYSCKQ